MAVKMRTGIDLNGQRAQNAGDASANTDLVTKQQMDAAVRGLSWKTAVKVATTGNGTLASSFANGQTVDGVSLVTGDRILLKNQTTQTENGIYTVNSSGAPTRALDADSTTELDSATVSVQQGTAGADTVWTQTTNAPTVGSSNLVWVQVGAGSTPYVAGNGLTLTGSTFDVVGGTGITVAADLVSIDTAVVARKFSASCVATTNPQTFAHGLGTADLAVTVKIVSSGEKVYPGITIDTTNITVDWGAAPTSAEYRVTAVG